MHQLPRKATSVKLVFGIIFIALCLPCSAVGIGMIAAPNKEGDAQSGLIVLVLALVVFGIPAVILTGLGLAHRAREERLHRIAALGRASARIPLGDLANELRATSEDTRSLILEAVNRGLLVGRLDVEHGVFVSGVVHHAVQRIPIRCPHCGGVSDVVVSPGTVASCQFCGHRVA